MSDPSMVKRYVVIGGEVQSKNDGDIHYVNSEQLMHLYRVWESDCYLLEDRKPYERDVMLRQLAPEIEEGKLHILRPKYDGNYSVPHYT